jgi:MarR family transcriptional regulator, organic hydroperoxide resistance regulator
MARPERDVAEDSLPLSEALDFLRLLWEVDHGLQVHSKRMRAELGVTGPQRLVIRFVGRRPGISAGELARLLHAHPSTLTGVLRRLERSRAIARHEDPVDGRRALFELTSRGRQIDQERGGTVESAAQRAMRRVGLADISAARRVLKLLSLELRKAK